LSNELDQINSMNLIVLGLALAVALIWLVIHAFNVAIRAISVATEGIESGVKGFGSAIRFIVGPAPKLPLRPSDTIDTGAAAKAALAALDISALESQLPLFDRSHDFALRNYSAMRLLRLHQLFRFRLVPSPNAVKAARMTVIELTEAWTEGHKRGRIIQTEAKERAAFVNRIGSLKSLAVAGQLTQCTESELNLLPGFIAADRRRIEQLLDFESTRDLPQSSVRARHLEMRRELENLEVELKAELQSRKRQSEESRARREEERQAALERHSRQAAELARENERREREKAAEKERQEQEWIRLRAALEAATRPGIDPSRASARFPRHSIVRLLNFKLPEIPISNSLPTTNEDALPRFVGGAPGELTEFLSVFDGTKLPPSRLAHLCEAVSRNSKEHVQRAYTELLRLDRAQALRDICPTLPIETLYDSEEHLLGINLDLPTESAFAFQRIATLKSGKEVVRPLTKAARERCYEFIQYALIVRTILLCAATDFGLALGAIALNGYVAHIDPASGRDRRSLIASVMVSDLAAVRSIVLERIDPKETFRAWKGIAGARMHELSAVRPILNLDRNDSRLRPDQDVMDRMDDRSNLASMEWQDFEHLVRQVFALEFARPGAEVKVTQSSRDRGVDAIAFDPDPIRGGKFVIQAKRYNGVVDVSAVRDLYGVLMNEGASRGILVTTSYFGRDSYEFAKDKPLTLISGSELLGLLEKHGYRFRIDLREESPH
jgi:HJR/Mrr/RecB family endonuclease